MISLPDDFLSELRNILGSDTEEYISRFSDEPYKGISVNRLKAQPEKLLPLLPFDTEKSPFYRDGYYYNGDAQGIGRHPLHHAGAFYVQEPSASSAVTLLDPHSGDKVLDLCAAPGGKSAQIASCLGGSGLIWSNEIVKSRAQILLSNFERMGIVNGVVSSCYPETLCCRLEGFFDRVLVDAPCSGEGMFRKDRDAIAHWSREHVRACAERQLSILDSACKALKNGGVLVYSTCTFSYEENEGVIKEFLRTHEDFEPYPSNETFGRKTELPCAVRITPIEGGEGHFAARLRRLGRTEEAAPIKKKPDSRADEIAGLLSDIFSVIPDGEIRVMSNKVFIIPALMPDAVNAGVIRAGVFAGELKKGRFEPAHALFASASPKQLNNVLDLRLGDDRLKQFLQGMELECDLPSGYAGVAVEGVMIGFGKCSGGRLKNKYPKGLRLL